MGTPLLRPVAPRGGARTWLALRQGERGPGIICLAHEVEPAAVAAIEGLRGLRHAHITRTLGVAHIDERPYALTALQPRESADRLRDRLARAGRPGLPAPVVLRLVSQIAGGLAALHARGLSHGAVDARRVALEYGGGATLLDAALSVHRAAPAADDIAALGPLLSNLTADAPPPVLDLARRIGEGGFSRAADVAAALDAWRLADPKAAVVDDARVRRWIIKVCGARWAVWRSVMASGDATPGPRLLDALAALLGAPREAPELPR